MTFLVVDRLLGLFPCLYCQKSDIYLFLTHFVLFPHIPQHYFSKYWGTDAWAIPPPQIFWGNRPPRPQSPLSLRPWTPYTTYRLLV